MGCWDDTDVDENPPSDKIRIRGCTDVLWFFIYTCFWSIMILIAGFAYVYGNPRRLVNGYDSFGNTCGSSFNEPFENFSLSGLDMSSKRFLFFMDVKNLRHSLEICVEKCPDRDLLNLDDLKSYFKETGVNLCRYDYDLNNDTNNELNPVLDLKLAVSSSLGPCPTFPIYKSKPVLNRCVPVLVDSLSKQIVGGVFAMLNSWDVVEQVLGDLYATWNYIVGLSFFALFLSLIIISLFYLFVSIVAYIIMVLVCVVSVVGTSSLWWTYFDIKYKLDNTPESELLEEAVQNEMTFFIYSIIASIITLVLLLLISSMRRRVDFLGTLFKEAAECLNELPFLYIQPIICFVQLIAFYIFWVSVVVCLATANYPGTKKIRPFMAEYSEYEISSTVPSNSYLFADNNSVLVPLNISIIKHKAFTFVEYVDATWVRYMWWVYIIGLVWTSEFLLSCQQFVISGAVARWYFNGWKKEEKSPILTSFRHLFCFHLGSAALGSFLITLFKLPRLIITYVLAKFKKYENTDYAYCFGSCKCCFWCLEKFIRYINHNAYVVVAMQGMNFCPAARRAFNILTNNALQFATINTLGDFILFLGKVIVTVVTGSFALLLLRNRPDLHFYSAPTLVISIFAYFIAHSVICLYEIVIDTLFLCVCEDHNINNGISFWRQSKLSEIKVNNGSTLTNPNVPELSPMNS